jgi:enoyl-CoA hydratase/carnithine racemase
VSISASMPGAKVGTLHIHLPGSLGLVELHALSVQFADAAAQDSRIVVLSGNHEIFCRGLDFAALEDASPQVRSAALISFAGCLEALRSLPHPVVAQVEGEALGGGVGLAAACDVVIAGEQASFGLPELLFGLIPGVVLPVLLERMTLQKARRMALYGHAHTAHEAKDLGLVDEVVATDALKVTVQRAVRRLSRSVPQAVAAYKRWSSEAPTLDLAAALKQGAERSAHALGRQGTMEGIRAFLDGGELPWMRR